MDAMVSFCLQKNKLDDAVEELITTSVYVEAVI
jgi:hypothetical protein